MNRIKLRSHLEFAELIRANISGPVKQQLISQAQRRLVDRLVATGAITVADADDLYIT